MTAVEATYSAPQARIVSAALELFTRHGVSGTSLQMIADAIGVTKAAVYHQFNTKEEIVIAAAEAELGGLESVVVRAEGEGSAEDARELLVTQIVARAIERGRAMSTILSDPVVMQYFAKHARLKSVMDRLCVVLVGDAGPDARVSAAMLVAAINGAVTHPLVARLDKDTLRAQLLRLAHRFLDLPD